MPRSILQASSNNNNNTVVVLVLFFVRRDFNRRSRGGAARSGSLLSSFHRGRETFSLFRPIATSSRRRQASYYSRQINTTTRVVYLLDAGVHEEYCRCFRVPASPSQPVFLPRNDDFPKNADDERG